MNSDKLQKVLDEIDQYNSQDPRHEEEDGRSWPVELLYSRRLSHWVLRLEPKASEALRIASRGQHIGRWTLPRSQYPMDRGGYLRWRENLKTFHAKTVTDIMRKAGYDEDAVGRVTALILKKNLKTDPEAQVLEDALCLVFLETQLAEFKSKTPEAKTKEVLQKTWKKMGPRGREQALQLPLEPDLQRFVVDALAL
jgi:hypothetical protein